MKVLKNKAIVSLMIALVGLTLVSTPIVGCATGEEEKPRPPLLLLRAGGISIDVDTEEIMRAGQILVCSVLEPKNNNSTLIPLFVVKGVVRIGPLNYNITEGRGVIAIQRHALTLFCNGTTPEGEDFTYRLLGRFTRTPEGLRPIMFIGMLKIEDSLQYVLFFLGRPRLFLAK